MQHSGPSALHRHNLVWLFLGKGLCMRSGPSDRRTGRRSRSPRISSQQEVAIAQRLSTRLEKVCGERRGGQSWRRRYKSICLQLLEHLQFLYQLLVQSTHPNTSRPVLQRAGQVDEAIQRCRANQLPGRSEPLLPRLAAESDVDSGAAETVVLSSAESEVEPVGTLEPSGVWSSGRYSSVRVNCYQSFATFHVLVI